MYFMMGCSTKLDRYIRAKGTASARVAGAMV